MPNKTEHSSSGRRQFLTNVLPTGALFCLGCGPLLAPPEILAGQQAPGPDVWTFAYRFFIPVFQIMAKDVGREKFIEMVKKASSENWAQKGSYLAKDIPTRGLTTYADWFVKIMTTPPFDKAFAFDVIEKSDKAFEVKFKECLPARIYREMQASDIGYAFDCYPMDAFARAFNPKMRLANPKNLVKGDDACLLRYTMEA
jgi:hypothetical protein